MNKLKLIRKDKRVSALIYLAFFVSFFEPDYVGDCCGGLSGLLLVLKAVYFIALFALSLKLLIERRNGIPCILFLAAALHGYLVLVTFAHGGRTLDSIKVFATVMAICMMVYVSVETKTFVLMLQAASVYFIVLAALSFITIMLWPDGLYLNIEEDVVYYENNPSAKLNAIRYLCGHKNSILTTLFPGVISLGVVAKLMPSKKASAATVSYLIMLTISTVIVDAVTSAMLCLALLGAFILSNRRSINGRLKVVVTAAIWLLNIGVSVFRVHYIAAPLFTLLNRNASLSGRTGIWDRALTLIGDSPLFGYGIPVEEAVKSSFGGFSTAHNMLLTMAYYGGLVGLCLYLACFVSAIKAIDGDSPSGTFVFLSIAGLMAMGMVESLGMGISFFAFPLAIAFFLHDGAIG